MLKHFETQSNKQTNKPLSLSYRWHRRSGITQVSYLQLFTQFLLFSKSASTTLLKCSKLSYTTLSNPEVVDFLVDGQKENIFWVLSATLSLEGVYLFRCPPQLGTWQAPHGSEDLFGMNALTVGAGGTKLWLHDGHEKGQREPVAVRGEPAVWVLPTQGVVHRWAQQALAGGG